MTAYSAAKLLFGDHRSTGRAAGTTHGDHPRKRRGHPGWKPRKMCFFWSNLDFSAMKQMLTLSIIILNHTYILHVLFYGLFYIRYILCIIISIITIIIITTIVSIIHDYYYNPFILIQQTTRHWCHGGTSSVRLWSQLSAASCRCCHRFGATDVAKATWAFAKCRGCRGDGLGRYCKHHRCLGSFKEKTMETDDTPFKVLGCFWMLNTPRHFECWMAIIQSPADLPTEDMWSIRQWFVSIV